MLSDAVLAANWNEATVQKNWALHIVVPSEYYDIETIWSNKGDVLSLPKEFIQDILIPACQQRSIENS